MRSQYENHNVRSNINLISKQTPILHAEKNKYMPRTQIRVAPKPKIFPLFCFEGLEATRNHCQRFPSISNPCERTLNAAEAVTYERKRQNRRLVAGFRIPSSDLDTTDQRVRRWKLLSRRHPRHSGNMLSKSVGPDYHTIPAGLYRGRLRRVLLSDINCELQLIRLGDVTIHQRNQRWNHDENW